MKHLFFLIFIALFISPAFSSGASNYNKPYWKEKHSFRPAASFGENTTRIGFVLLAAAASGIITHDDKFNTTLAYISGGFIVGGVVIHLTPENTKKRIKTAIFGNRNHFGIRFKF